MSRKPILVLKHGKIAAGHLLTAFENLNIPYQICNTANGDIPPEDMDAFSGVAVMGGMMGVYEHDKYTWLSREIDWVDRFIETGKPVFGICLGCQMLAHIFDGEVYSGEKGLNVGFKRIELMDEDPTFGEELADCHVPVFHGDTYTLPDRAERMARGSYYYEQGARFAENVYGTQFHPEVTEDIIREWYEHALKDKRFQETLTLEELLDQAEKYLPKTQDWLEKFLGRLFKA